MNYSTQHDWNHFKQSLWAIHNGNQKCLTVLTQDAMVLQPICQKSLNFIKIVLCDHSDKIKIRNSIEKKIRSYFNRHADQINDIAFKCSKISSMVLTYFVFDFDKIIYHFTINQHLNCYQPHVFFMSICIATCFLKY